MLVVDIISLIVYLVISLLITAYILYYFTRKNPLFWYEYLILGITYCICIFAAFLLVVDIAQGYNMRYIKYHSLTTNDTDCTAPLYLQIIWYDYYWTIQVLAWVIIPITQAYVLSGHFTILRKILDSIIANIVSYIVYFCIIVGAAVLLVIFLIKYGKMGGSFLEFLSALNNFCIGLSTLYGIVVMIFFLSYGLASLPKKFWNKGNIKRDLTFNQFRFSKLHDRYFDHESKFERNLRELKVLDMQIEESHFHRKHLDTLLVKYEKDLEASTLGVIDVKMEKYSGKKLRGFVKLHKNLIKSKREFKQIEFQINDLVQRSLFFEDVLHCLNDPSQKKITSIFYNKPKILRNKTFDLMEWFYYGKISPILWKLVSFLFIAIGLFIIWCELSQLVQGIVHINLNPISGLSTLSAPVEILNQLINVVIIIGLTFIILYGLFSFKLFSNYKLLPKHSDVSGLLFTLVFIYRISSAILFNYTQMVGAQKRDGIAFFSIMSSLDGLKVVTIGSWVILGLPLLIPILTFIFYFEITDRLLSLCGIERFKFETSMVSNFERIKEGKKLMKQERKRKILKMKRDNELDDNYEDYNPEVFDRVILTENFLEKMVNKILPHKNKGKGKSGKGEKVYLLNSHESETPEEFELNSGFGKI